MRAIDELRACSRQVARRLPGANRLVTRARWASLRRTAPISKWGRDRGAPIDRWYIERFLRLHAADVHGHVLEVLEDLYATSLGAEMVDVLDIDATNPRATLVGDVCNSSTLTSEMFDAIVLTQTLQFVSSPRAALENLVGSLKPGGTLLLSVPSLSRVAGDSDRWRWTPLGLADLADGLDGEIEVAGHGNALACRAFLMGLAAEDLPGTVLTSTDSSYPVVATARLVRSFA